MKTHTLGDISLVLSEPVAQSVQWIGQAELLDQILACWTKVTEDDLPLTPRLVGKPGLGKTTLAQAAAERMGRPAFIFQCTMDTRPEDLLITPVLSGQGKISYHASPLVTAMIEGGVAILDEANRMSEKSWASLAPLFDHRRYAESVVAGVRIPAHESFRCCVTMNDDASTYEIPEYMVSRLQPKVEVDFPSRDEERAILRYNVDFAPDDLLELTVHFLQQAHGYNLNYSTRDGINIMRYAIKLMYAEERGVAGAPAAKPAGSPKKGTQATFQQAMEQVLGEGADRFEERATGMFFQSPLRDISQFMMRPDDLGDDDDDDEIDEVDDGEDDRRRPR